MTPGERAARVLAALAASFARAAVALDRLAATFAASAAAFRDFVRAAQRAAQASPWPSVSADRRWAA